MKITESRLRRLIRQVIRESVPSDPHPTPGDMIRAAAAAEEFGDDERDFSGMDPGYDAATDTYLDTTAEDARDASGSFPPGESWD
jgi:hypothetical protein